MMRWVDSDEMRWVPLGKWAEMHDDVLCIPGSDVMVRNDTDV
jgi:hypothetical protein